MLADDLEADPAAVLVLDGFHVPAAEGGGSVAASIVGPTNGESASIEPRTGGYDRPRHLAVRSDLDDGGVMKAPRRDKIAHCVPVRLSHGAFLSRCVTLYTSAKLAKRERRQCLYPPPEFLPIPL